MSAAPSASQPVLIVMSVLAGLNVVNAGLGVLNVVSATVVGLLALGTAAFSAGFMFYLRGVVVPVDAVGARLTGDGKMVTGGADPTIQPGTEVEIHPTSPEGYRYLTSTDEPPSH